MAKTSGGNARGAQSKSPAAKAAAASRRESFLPDNRIDRWLAGGFIGLLGLSVLCFILLMLASGLKWFGDFLGPIYVASIAAVTYFGLPVAILLMVVLTIRMAIRRSKENKAA